MTLIILSRTPPSGVPSAKQRMMYLSIVIGPGDMQLSLQMKCGSSCDDRRKRSMYRCPRPGPSVSHRSK